MYFFLKINSLRAILVICSMLCSSNLKAQEIGNIDYNLNKKCWPWATPTDNNDEISILLLGDTNIQNRKNPEGAWEYMLPTLRGADLRLLNLEGPFAGKSIDPNNVDIPHKSGWAHSEPDQVKALVHAQIDAVGVANNVTYPWQALLRSLDVLDAAGIKHSGGGKTKEEAHQPVIFERKGIKTGFIQYTSLYWPYNHASEENKPGVAGLKVSTWYQAPPNMDKPGQPPIVLTLVDEVALEKLKTDISCLKEKTDIVIASFHWGVSGSPEIVSYQRTLAQAAIDAGADLVMGHGPHVFQPIEVYKGKPIFYCIGNSVFDWYKKKDKDLDGLLLRVTAKKSGITGISMVPLSRDKNNLPVLLDPNSGRGAALYEQLVQLSKPSGIMLSIEGKEIVIN